MLSAWVPAALAGRLSRRGGRVRWEPVDVLPAVPALRSTHWPAEPRLVSTSVALEVPAAAELTAPRRGKSSCFPAQVPWPCGTGWCPHGRACSPAAVA